MTLKNKLGWSFLLLLLLPGCAGERKIGGREFPLTILTTKDHQPLSGATAYVVPYDEWLRLGKDIDDPTCRKFLSEYKVTDGKTPVTVYGVSHQMVIIVDWQNHLTKASSTVVPGDSDRPSVTIEVN
jgi:hypothetical protein